MKLPGVKAIGIGDGRGQSAAAGIGRGGENAGAADREQAAAERTVEVEPQRLLGIDRLGQRDGYPADRILRHGQLRLRTHQPADRAAAEAVGDVLPGRLVDDVEVAAAIGSRGCGEARRGRPGDQRRAAGGKDVHGVARSGEDRYPDLLAELLNQGVAAIQQRVGRPADAGRRARHDLRVQDRDLLGQRVDLVDRAGDLTIERRARGGKLTAKRIEVGGERLGVGEEDLAVGEAGRVLAHRVHRGEEAVDGGAEPARAARGDGEHRRQGLGVALRHLGRPAGRAVALTSCEKANRSKARWIEVTLTPWPAPSRKPGSCCCCTDSTL